MPVLRNTALGGSPLFDRIPIRVMGQVDGLPTLSVRKAARIDGGEDISLVRGPFSYNGRPSFVAAEWRWAHIEESLRLPDGSLLPDASTLDATSKAMTEAEQRIRERVKQACYHTDLGSGIWSLEQAVDCGSEFSVYADLNRTTFPFWGANTLRGYDTRPATAIWKDDGVLLSLWNNCHSESLHVDRFSGPDLILAAPDMMPEFTHFEDVEITKDENLPPGHVYFLTTGFWSLCVDSANYFRFTPGEVSTVTLYAALVCTAPCRQGKYVRLQS